MGLSVFISVISCFSFLAAGFRIPDAGAATHLQNTFQPHDPVEWVTTTEWSAECVSRVIPITLEQTSDKTYTSDSADYDIGLFHALGTKKILVTGTYNINTRLCTPGSEHRIAGRRSDTIQFLIHGATYNSMMWYAYLFYIYESLTILMILFVGTGQ